MGVYHFSGLFVLLCLGLGSALLSSLGEHVFYRLVLPRIRRGNKLQYWLHTSQVRWQGQRRAGGADGPPAPMTPLSVPRRSTEPSTLGRRRGHRRGRSRSAGELEAGRGPRAGARQAVQATNSFSLRPSDPGPEEQPRAAEGAGRWRRVRRAVERERRVRFLLETGEAGADRPRLCSNGPGPQAELRELELRIEATRERLRSALLRRGELRARLGDGARLRPLRLLQGTPAES